MPKMRLTFTVSQKVAAGYLLIVTFSLVAIIYALGSLHAQTKRSERLIAIDFKALSLLRNLRHNVLAQETLERQFEILRDTDILDLLDSRRAEFSELRRGIAALPLPEVQDRLASLLAQYEKRSRLLADRRSTAPPPEIDGEMIALRSRLIDNLDRAAIERQEAMDAALAWFNRESANAFRNTLLLAFVGIVLSAPAAIAIVLGIHRSIRSLIRASQEIAAGTFDPPIALADREDEFGLLAREFRDMGHKLRDLDQLRLDANPLTQLPGNLAIDRELEKYLAAGTPFAHLYIDLDHFKAYNDRYGYRAGSEIISRTADLIRQTVMRHGTIGDLVGHIGGDDFVVVTPPERAETIARSIIESFDRMIPDFYSEEDRGAGFFTSKDRFGEKRDFPLLTMSIAIVLSEHLDTPSPQAVSRECVKMKEHLKSLPGSNYLIDRRKII
jgi:GGDEF domain-containing protein